jgi:integrase
MPNLNHPRKGDVIRVEPIRDLKAIKSIKKLLSDKPRDLCLFTLGINTNLRASDLTALTIQTVRHVQPGGHFVIRERKTGKIRNITINVTVFDALQKLLKQLGEDAKNEDYLFQSRKGKGMLTVPYMNSLVKGWCALVGLRGNYGSHSLRKTMGFVHRTVFNTDLPTLCHMFNHSTQRQTLTYLGIQEQEVQTAYLREI